jgi:phosphopantothenoylcysteine decarboxylase / phosphopantothenate---cysteine ligase
MRGKRIILGVTGGIAAYKSAELVRRLSERGAEVQVVMTAAAREFVTATTFQALSGRPVRDSLWDAAAEAAMGHIELARWAELVLIAPASAGFLARLAGGMADDLLATLCLATSAPIVVVPAMNQQMWANAATQANMATLRSRAIDVFGPASGDQACGEIGPGRMMEPGEIADHVEQQLFVPGPLSGRRVLVTAGPTRECIDPVRFVSNRSSGKMGFAVALALRAAGAEVTLDMVRTTDILAWVAARASERPFVVGFAAETDAVEQHAREKLLRKNLDMIAANEVGEYKAFDCDDNALLVLWRGGRAELPRAAKADLAAALAALIVARYAEQPALAGRTSAKG